MSFASLAFFLFLPLVFCVHWLASNRKWQNGVLLATAYVFYGWWDWRFCFLMMASSLIDYFAGLWIDVETDQGRRKKVLVVALSGNLLILGFFKYFKFFVESFIESCGNLGIHLPAWSWQIVLPVGVSFYTFQSMSYTIDVYLGRCRASRSVFDYLTFVSFFPQLLAGPIERATALLPQFQHIRVFSSGAASEGCRFIIWGLAKKMLVADPLAEIANIAYGFSARSSAAQLFLGSICFAFQIYCDFSAYSDIAVGTARLFGIQLMRNFAYPYFSQSITEFWRRWHISLSTWFRDYIYIPLGGNRVSSAKQYRNLLIVALVSGLWHGAAWHFIVWGALHGIYLVTERALMRKDNPASRRLLSIVDTESLVPDFASVLCMLRTFTLACIGWVFFRAQTVGDGLNIVWRITTAMFHARFYADVWQLVQSWSPALAALGALILIEWWNRKSWNPFAIAHKPFLLRWAAYTMVCWYLLLFGTHQTEEFIYFQF